jgi:PTH1 family peptidyl-tRNA hydrolase
VIAGQRCLLLWPQTYMNLSGGSVLAARDFFKVEAADLLIVGDDLNLPLAKLRFRAGGSAGGQRGLDNILVRLGTDQVPRLRIGIGAPRPGQDAATYVLGRFNNDEWRQLEPAIWQAAEGVEAWVADGLPACMNRYNGPGK